jgi:hypothetical protein
VQGCRGRWPLLTIDAAFGGTFTAARVTPDQIGEAQRKLTPADALFALPSNTSWQSCLAPVRASVVGILRWETGSSDTQSLGGNG